MESLINSFPHAKVVSAGMKNITFIFFITVSTHSMTVIDLDTPLTIVAKVALVAIIISVAVQGNALLVHTLVIWALAYRPFVAVTRITA